VGTQGVQITNQAIIYRVAPGARSRVNSAYMVCYFVGGALGSISAGVVLGSAGWSGVCWLGAGFGGLLLVSALLDVRSGAASRERPALAATSPVEVDNRTGARR